MQKFDLHKNPDLKKNIFKVPENYFENLDSKILSRIEKRNTYSFSSLLSSFRLQIVSGVSVAFVIMLFFYFSTHSTQPKQLSGDELLASISQQDLENYFEETNLDQIDIVLHVENSNSNFTKLSQESIDINDELLNEMDVYDLELL